MLLGKKRKPGRKIKDMTIGEKLTLTEKIEDNELLLYLGLTNDANPLYIQHDYASQTPFKKPIVPSIMLTGIITSAVSKYLPGPGSHITEQSIQFHKPVYHYATVRFLFEVKEIDLKAHSVIIEVTADNEDDERVVTGRISVCPPHRLEKMNSHALENF
ncbi:MaoC family dehydratase N-terminal domain-containing protein [Bacillus sp. JRC01]|nr:MaoC family dehydratase N-terminal domain-containing protein [Bacillus sp. JRC01]